MGRKGSTQSQKFGDIQMISVESNVQRRIAGPVLFLDIMCTTDTRQQLYHVCVVGIIIFYQYLFDCNQLVQSSNCELVSTSGIHQFSSAGPYTDAVHPITSLTIVKVYLKDTAEFDANAIPSFLANAPYYPSDVPLLTEEEQKWERKNM